MNKKNILYFIILLIISCFFLISAYCFFNHYKSKNQNEIFSVSKVNKSFCTHQQIFEIVWMTIKKNYLYPDMNKQDWNRWKRRYIREIKTQEDAKVAIDSMLASLDDPYSKYMNKKEYAEQNINIDAKITGIGVNVTSLDGKTVVINVVEDTPAQKSGLKPKDVINKIDGKSINGFSLDNVVPLIRGEIGTIVKIEIIRGDKKINFEIKRAEINIKNVISKKLENNIGYIQIVSFIGANVANEFINAMKDLSATSALIIDVRGNPGGLLPNAIEISNIFIDGGTIVNLVKRNGLKFEIKAEKTGFSYDKPLIILIDEYSASASEILSGALKDNQKAILVGEKTFGKGLIQKIFPLPNSTGMNLTVGKYLTPLSHDINKKGIKPDYFVEMNEKIYIKLGDIQLKKAIEILKNEKSI